MATDPTPGGQILIYRDGDTRLQVRLEGRTVWLSQRLIAELFQVSVKTANEHLVNIYNDGELDRGATVRSFRIVQVEGSREVARAVEHYNLEAILAVGYRVRSARGTAFRQWATARLSELLVKGFALDDERIKEGRTLGADYFDELLERIRDIRASERMFYQKVTDIYATSIDYDPTHPISQTFFATVQNKLHWAIHGHTAAEIIRLRAAASRPHMGLTTWKNAPHGPIRGADVTVAKNYLSEAELRELNRIVSMYLDYAEDQARRRKPMHMPTGRPGSTPSCSSTSATSSRTRAQCPTSSPRNTPKRSSRSTRRSAAASKPVDRSAISTGPWRRSSAWSREPRTRRNQARRVRGGSRRSGASGREGAMAGDLGDAFPT